MKKLMDLSPLILTKKSSFLSMNYIKSSRKFTINIEI